MNHDLLIKTTNRVALYATVALFYWVFIFLTLTVFDLKIFREQMTETFFLSLLGIFAVLGGAIVLNVMSNLSKISDALSADSRVENTARRRPVKIVLVLLSFPLIASALFAGDYLSAQRKKAFLVSSAQRLILENQKTLASLADYKFSPEYVNAAETSLRVLKKIDKNFPEVMILFQDEIDGKKVLLGFRGNTYAYNDKERAEKVFHVCSITPGEREYAERVFSGKESAFRFHAQRGNYELYFPTTVDGKRLLLYFSDFQRYGKLGS